MSKPSRQGPIIFPHIPKCGGSSVLKILENTGKSLFLDYDAPPSHREWTMLGCERRNREFARLDFSVFDFIYGHFPLERYRRGNKGRQIILLLRHPIERMISQYYFWKDMVPDNDYSFLAIEPEIADLKAEKMDLPAFCDIFGMKDFYTRYTQLPDTSGFLLVGFTDLLPEFFQKLSQYTGYVHEEFPAERQNSSRIDLSAAVRKELESRLAKEIEWYEAQRRLWT